MIAANGFSKSIVTILDSGVYTVFQECLRSEAICIAAK